MRLDLNYDPAALFLWAAISLPVPASEHNCYSSIIKEMLKIAKCKDVDKEKSFRRSKRHNLGSELSLLLDP